MISWKISRRTVSPSLIWGVTRRVMPMSWRSMFWLVARLSLAWVIPPADWTRLVTMGMLAPTLISASSLSEVRTWGAERMLVFPRLAEARIRP